LAFTYQILADVLLQYALRGGLLLADRYVDEDQRSLRIIEVDIALRYRASISVRVYIAIGEEDVVGQLVPLSSGLLEAV
jgi:hypothetical protein